MPKVSIIVLQYNKSDSTLKCLESLRHIDANVVVVDNNSEVQHLKNVQFWIESRKLLNFKLLNLEKNTGYAGGNNAGIKYAFDHGAEQVLILNNDVVLEELPSGKEDIIGVEKKTVFGFEYLSGEVLLLKKPIYFDERYFLYYEDVELCQRAKKEGLTLGLAKVKYQHEVSASTKSLGPANLLYYHARNALLLLATHGTFWQKATLPFWQFWLKLKQRIKILLKKDLEISRSILQGVEDFQNKKYGSR